MTFVREPVIEISNYVAWELRKEKYIEKIEEMKAAKFLSEGASNIVE